MGLFRYCETIAVVWVTSNFNSIPKIWQKKSNEMHWMAKTAIFDRSFWAFQNGRSRVPAPEEKKSWPISMYFHPRIPKIQLPRHNSLCRSRYHIPHVLAVKVHICRGVRNIGSQKKTVILAKKKSGSFSILWNNCSGVSELKIQFYTEDLANEKR